MECGLMQHPVVNNNTRADLETLRLESFGPIEYQKLNEKYAREPCEDTWTSWATISTSPIMVWSYWLKIGSTYLSMCGESTCRTTKKRITFVKLELLNRLSSSLACVTFVFLFWEGRIVHIPMNTASRGLSLHSKGPHLSGCVSTGNAISLPNLVVMARTTLCAVDVNVCTTVKWYFLPEATAMSRLSFSLQIHPRTYFFVLLESRENINQRWD